MLFLKEKERKVAEEKRLAEKRAAAKARQEAEFAANSSVDTSESKIKELTEQEAAQFQAAQVALLKVFQSPVLYT